MTKPDIVTHIVNSISEKNGIILTQIGSDRKKLEAVVVKALQIGFLRKAERYFSKEELIGLIGLIGYGIQEKTGVAFGYCGEECMNGNGDITKNLTCDHIKSLCEYKPMEQNLGKLAERIASDCEKIDSDLEKGRLLSKVNEAEGMNVPSSRHSIATFFSSEPRQGLKSEEYL